MCYSFDLDQKEDDSSSQKNAIVIDDQTDEVEKLIRKFVFPLAKAKEVGTETAMICGQLDADGTQNVRESRELFHRASEVAFSKGITVFNQYEFNLEIFKIAEWGDDYLLTLDGAYWQIFEKKVIDRLFFLPHWRGSDVARAQRRLAKEKGLIVEKYPRKWLK